MEIVAIIPARGDSKRLKRKNIYPILGKPMLLWVTEECEKSKHITRFVVSTEDQEIKNLCIENGVEVIHRPEHLSADDVEKMDVIEQATDYMEKIESYVPDVVISLQPNSPELQYKDLDGAIEFFLEKLYPYYPVAEVMSINPDMLQNACFRIMTRKTVFQKTLSTHVGVYMTDYIDVHSIEDVEIIEKRLKCR